MASVVFYYGTSGQKNGTAIVRTARITSVSGIPVFR